jgi:hypothetical protein
VEEQLMDIPTEQQTTFGPRGSKNIQPLKSSTISQQRRQHRSNADADADADDDEKLPAHVRFKDLVQAGVVSNHMQLTRMIKTDGFPPGFLVSANIRLWNVADVRAWLAAKQQANA